MNIKLRELKYSIIGLGLIGGSLAKSIRKFIDPSCLYACDNNIEFIKAALKDGVISGGKTSPDEDIYQSDVIFLCTPLKQAVEFLDDLAENAKNNCVITDVVSTKKEISRYVESMDNPPCFVGGHPMTGSEKTGYPFSSAHLFENAYYILSPGKTSTSSSVKTLKEIVLNIGGIPVEIDSDTHDFITSAVSHVPHVIASALVNMIKMSDTKDEYMKMLAAGGFKDITRIASANPDMWKNIVTSNKFHVIKVLSSYIEYLKTFIVDLDNGHDNLIYDFFQSAREYRDSFPKSGKGLISSANEITIDVTDRPGIIGEIATVLGKNNINIKNINVTNSREFEKGCIIISLSDDESLNKALFLLSETGYKVYRR